MWSSSSGAWSSETADVVGALLRYESERRRRAEDLVALSRRGVERLHAKDESTMASCTGRSEPRPRTRPS